MTIEKNVQGNTMVMKLTGWLDTQAAMTLEEEIEGLDPNTEKLILDFSELEYISSSGLREIVAAYKKLNGNLLLRNVSDEIMDVIKITGVVRKIKFE